MKYRAELDGLRAVAVLSVILFHGGYTTFEGGFVGVDVFFVISGYLMTTIVLEELRNGNFDLREFYVRRVRRIVPALFVVIAASIPFAWFWLLPLEMYDFSESVIAAALFASNVLFWREAGYFETAAELKPILHTWSLSVEGQFYLIFPLLTLLVIRYCPRAWSWIIGALTVASLLFAEYLIRTAPSAAFYLFPTRIWEFGVGVLLATSLSRHGIYEVGKPLKEFLALLGLGMILWAVFRFGAATPFPGAYALVPVVGTALVIGWATADTWVGRALSSRILVGLGLISYSVYLVHHPVLAFARHRSLHPPSEVQILGYLALSILIAWVVWRFVERPFRRRQALQLPLTLASSFFLSAFVAFSLVGSATAGYFNRESMKDSLAALEHAVRPNVGLDAQCEHRFVDHPACRTHSEPEVLLWGDSFAMHLASGLIASDPDIKLIQATVSVCGPVFGAAPMNNKYPEPWARDCLESNLDVLEYIKMTPSLRYAVLSSPFIQYVEDGWRLLLEDGSAVVSADHGLEYFLQTLERLRGLGIRPVVVSPTPENGHDHGRCLTRAKRLGYSLARCDFMLEQSVAKQKSVRDFLEHVEAHAEVVWLDREICLDGVCRAAIDDVFIYRDAGHLSYAGSALLGKRLDFSGIIRDVAR